MKEEFDMDLRSNISRRDFIRASATAAAGVGLTGLVGCEQSQVQSMAHTSGSDKIRVGLIGCGGRGTGAMANCVKSSPGIEVYAMGDVFQDRLDKSVKNLKDYKPNDVIQGRSIPRVPLN